MDNAQKAIMIGVGLFITIIIITAVMAIVNIAQGMIGGATGQLNNLSSQMQNELTTSYDDTVISGAKVLQAVKQYYDNEDLLVVVQNNVTAGAKDAAVAVGDNCIWTTPNKATLTAADASYTFASVVANENQPTVGKMTSGTSKNDRIVTTGKYHAFLIKDGKDVRGIAFIRIS